jgi:hypothetical protein
VSAALYQLHKRAVLDLEGKGGAAFNWLITEEFETASLKDMTIVEERDRAAQWRSAHRPADMYFTHGEYGASVSHIVQELKRKETSHRALYSLLNKKVIEGSGDDPIPSFLTLQCQLDGVRLHCTCTFRALEVAVFFKVNLEEIRQTLVELYDAFPEVKRVSLGIFAFRAYLAPDSRPLLKPKMDSMHSDELLVLLMGAQGPADRQLDTLLAELENPSTVVIPDGLETLQRLLQNAAVKFDQTIASRSPQLVNELPSAIEAAGRLASLRHKASSGDALKEAWDRYKKSLGKLRGILQS